MKVKMQIIPNRPFAKFINDSEMKVATVTQYKQSSCLLPNGILYRCTYTRYMCRVLHTK
jgi:hypothetical protein